MRTAVAGEAALIAQLDHPSRHADILTRLAALRLAAGDLETGLVLAGRRCRIAPLPGTLDFVLRAELLRRLCHEREAEADIKTALDLEPDDLLANRKQLSFGPEDRRSAAALHLIAFDREPSVVVAALKVLADGGIARAGSAAIMDGNRIEGWVAWSGDDQLDVNIDDGLTSHTIRIATDRDHALSGGMGHAAKFVITGARTQIGRWHGTSGQDSPIHLRRAFSAFDGDEAAASSAPIRIPFSTLPPHDVTVVVPVYGDLDATRACLDSLQASLAEETLRVRILVVNDASPVPGLAAYLQSLDVDVITNPANLGFVGAVNAALRDIASGDVVLLNADTIVPPGAIGRLAAAARTAFDIGTVTPLSNNGELVSLPVPYRENPLPQPAAIAHIDRVAQAVHAGRTMDLPVGIGFCLYITRACLDAAGPLSNRYERGYGEDVHFCLAAAAAGFRNVGALSVYVGHAGTRSFGADKRRLVMRNAKRVAERFPHHDAEVDAFVIGDPLRTVRHAIGCRLIEGFTGRLIVAGSSSVPQAVAWAGTCTRDGRPSLLLHRERERIVLRAFDESNALTAETSFDLPDQLEQFHVLCASLTPSRIDVFDPLAFAMLGFDAHRHPVDIHLADLSALAHRSGNRNAEAVAHWDAMVAGAENIIAPDTAAFSFAALRWPEAVSKIVRGDILSRPSLAAASKRVQPRLGVLLVNETASCRRLLRALAAGLPRCKDDFPPVTVLGDTAGDLPLMRAGGIIISGKLDLKEIPAVAAHHGLTHVFALASGAIFGAPCLQAARAMPLPLATFAWTRPDDTAPEDLMIDPKLSDGDVTAALAAWLIGGEACI